MLKNLLIEILKIEIIEIFDFKIEFHEAIEGDNIFRTITFKIKTVEEKNIDAFIKIIQIEDLGKAIFNYWGIAYGREMRKYKLEEILKNMYVCLYETENYEKIYLLGNKTKRDFKLRVYQLQLYKYIKDKIKNLIEIEEWLDYIEENNEDILMLGIITKRGMNDCKEQSSHSL